MSGFSAKRRDRLPPRSGEGGGRGAPLLDVRNLTKLYVTRSGWPRATRHEVRAVDDVSFTIRPGETFGLVGESGCGKSTIARCVLRLIAPTSGSVWFDGRDLLEMPPEEMRSLRREMQIIFQDPYSSLDPRMRVKALVAEPLEIHGVGTRESRERRVSELLERVGLGEGALTKFPHEFSGGQRQRIGIARALALSPRLVIADEPVSALDLSVRAQVINLLMELQRDFSLTYLFIAHDLALVRRICDRVAVMQQGRIVELARAVDLFADPRHPYTKTLLAAVPEPDPRRRGRTFADDGSRSRGTTGVGAGVPPVRATKPTGDDAARPEKSDDADAARPARWEEVAPEHWLLTEGSPAA